MNSRTPWLIAAAATALTTAFALHAVDDAYAQEPDSPGQRICDHLAAHAEDYDQADADECLGGIQELLASIPEEKRAPLADCVTSHVPIGKEAFMECMLGSINEDPDVQATPPSDGDVETRIGDVCLHLTSNAVDFSDEDAAACPDTFRMLHGVLGDEPFEAVTGCLLAAPSPSQEDLEACVETHAAELK